MSVPDDGTPVGAHFGLTPKRYQSGETDVVGRITKVGGGMVRSLLYEAAHTMLTRSCRFSRLKHWAMEVAEAAWSQAGDGGTGPQALDRAATYLDERGRIPLRQGSRRGVNG
jgi:Transposase IS116/IS110/IS902 family